MVSNWRVRLYPGASSGIDTCPEHGLTTVQLSAIEQIISETIEVALAESAWSGGNFDSRPEKGGSNLSRESLVSNESSFSVTKLMSSLICTEGVYSPSVDLKGRGWRCGRLTDLRAVLEVVVADMWRLHRRFSELNVICGGTGSPDVALVQDVKNEAVHRQVLQQCSEASSKAADVWTSISDALSPEESPEGTSLMSPSSSPLSPFICSRRLSWERSLSLESLGPSGDCQAHRLEDPWILSPRTLRRIIALSLTERTSIREMLFRHCSSIIVIAQQLLHCLMEREWARPQASKVPSACKAKADDEVLWSSYTAEELASSSLAANSVRNCHVNHTSDFISTVQGLFQGTMAGPRESAIQSISIPAMMETTVLLTLDFVFHLCSRHVSSMGSSECESSLCEVASSTAEPFKTDGNNSPSYSPSNVSRTSSEADVDPGLFHNDFLSNPDTGAFDNCATEAAVGATMPGPCMYQQGLGNALGVASGTRNLVVLVAGAAGCGKSTLACFLASRLGLGAVVSTDTVRHILRSVYSKSDCPILYASTYETGKHVSDSDAESEADKLPFLMQQPSMGADSGGRQPLVDLSPQVSRLQSACRDLVVPYHGVPSHTEKIVRSKKSLERLKCIVGYLKQAEMIFDRLEFVIEQTLKTEGSIVVEGVHLTGGFIRRIQARFPRQCVAFLVYLSNEATHVDRLAGRSANFSTEPTENKYVHHIESIRAIQRFLQLQAMQHQTEGQIALIDNVSMSSSMRQMHSIIVEYLRHV